MSRKKKKPRRPGRRNRPTLPPRFSIGTAVRVRNGVADADFPDIPLGGWTGHVREVDRRANPPLYLIAWTQDTLDHVHPIYRKRCERDGLEIEYCWLSEQDIEESAGPPVPMEQPTRIVTHPLQPDDPDDRIRAALGLTSDDPIAEVEESTLRTYHAYLARQLALPFPALWHEPSGPLEAAPRRLTVTALLDLEEGDEEEGLRIAAFDGTDELVVPLAEVEVDSRGPNRQLVEDYSSWFWNWREPGISFVRSPGWSGAQARRGTLLVPLAETLLIGCVGGGAVGAIVASLDGTAMSAQVGAVLVGLAGGLFGAYLSRGFSVANRSQSAFWLCSGAGLVWGVVLGGVVGALLVAFPGALLGGLGLWAVHKLMSWLFRKPRAGWLRLSAGMMVGGAVQAWLHNATDAWLGTWIGALAGGMVVFLMLLSLMLATATLDPAKLGDDQLQVIYINK